MAASKRILYIGGGREGLETIQKVRSLDLEILYIQQKHKFSPAVLPYVDQVVLIDFENIDILVPVAKTLYELFPFITAISMSEPALVPVSHVCEALGLPGNSVAAVRGLKDKALMRERLKAANISPMAAQPGQSQADIAEFARAHGLPMIVKPSDASGSLGVYRIDTLDQIDQVWQQLQSLKLPHFLMEEYLDGPEISVETFSFHGRHVILAMTDKLTLPNHVELGHSMPAQIDCVTADAVEALVSAFLDAIGLMEGPAHTEIKLTANGPRIVESQNRPGGDRINEMLHVTYGLDMKLMAVQWLCGMLEPLHESPQPHAGAAIRFFIPKPGLVREVGGIGEVGAADGIVELQVSVKPGDTVRPVNQSYDRSGHILVCGADVREAIHRCEMLRQQVNIVTIEPLDPAG